MGSDLSGIERHLAELDARGASARNFRAYALFNHLRDRYLPVERGRCLDVGCGDGVITVRLAQAGWDVTGLDPSQRLIERARHRFDAAGLRGDFHIGGATEAPALGQFDLVTCLDVLEHIEDDVGAIHAVRAALVPGGIAIFSVPALTWLYGPRDRAIGHYRRYDRRTFVERLAHAGFEVLACQFWNLIGVFPYWFASRLLRREIYDGLRKGSDSLVKRAVRAFLVRWLALEARVPLPIGLTLIGVARRVSFGRPSRGIAGEK